MSKLLSDKVKKISADELSPDRYQFLRLSEAEPDLGSPSANGSILTGDIDGARIWKDPSEISGFLGSTGFTGSKGYTGSQGFTGSQGPAGAAGGEGSIGFTGSKGDIGYTGSQGIQGVTGFTGSRGATGFTGSTGFVGSQGVQGFTGSQGPVAGTDGQVVYNNGGIASGANLYYDDVNDRVGVKTASPSYDLDVVGSTNISGSLIVGGDLTVSGNTTVVNTTNLDVQDAVITLNTGQSTPSNDIGVLFQRYATANTTNYNVGIAWDEATDRLIFGATGEDGNDNDLTFSNEWMTINDSGNVGIGISTPNAKVEVYDPTAPKLMLSNDETFKLSIEVSGGLARFRSYNAVYGLHRTPLSFNLNAGDLIGDGGLQLAGSTIQLGNNSHRIFSTPNDFAIAHTTNAFKGFRFLGNVPENTLVIESNGRVGIGTSTPGATLDITETWNDVNTAFTAISLDVTDTASDADSSLLHLKVIGDTRFNVTKDGDVIIPSNQYIISTGGAAKHVFGINSHQIHAGNRFLTYAGTELAVTGGGDQTVFAYGFRIGTRTQSANSSVLYGEALNTISQRNGTAAQTFNVYNTYTDASNYERGVFKWDTNVLEIGTEALGTGTGRGVSLTTASGRYLSLSNATTLDTNAVYTRFYASSTVFAHVNGDTKKIAVGSNGQYVFTSGLDSFATAADTGIARDSAGVIKISDGSTGLGSIVADNINLQSLNLSPTWNDAGTTFTAISANITDTASAADSKLIDLQVGGVSKFNVAKGGQVGINRAPVTAYALAANGSIYASQNLALGGNTSAITMGALGDIILIRDAANTLALRNSTNAQTFNVYNTYTDTSNYERGVFKWDTNVLEIGTEALGTGTKRNVNINTNTTIDGSLQFASDGAGANWLKWERLASNNWRLTSSGVGHIMTVIGNAVTIPQNVIIQRGGLSVERSLLSASPALGITETWNDSGITFTAMQSNITDTASAADSKLIDLQVGGTSAMSVGKNGYLTLLNSGSVAIRGIYNNGMYVSGDWRVQGDVWINRSDAIKWDAAGWPSSNSTDLVLERDAAGTLAQRNGTNAQTFNVYNTYTDTSNYERGVFKWDTNVLEIGTEAAGTGISRNINIAPSTNVVEFGNSSSTTVTLQTPNISNYNFKIRPRGTNSSITLESPIYQTFEIVENITNGALDFKIEGSKIKVGRNGTTFGKVLSSNTVKLFGADGDFSNDYGKNVEFYTGGAQGSNTAIDLRGGDFSFGLGRGHGTTLIPQFAFKTRLGSVRGVDHTEHTLLALKEQTAYVNGNVEIKSILSVDAETATLATLTQTTIASFAAATYASGKFVVQAKDTVSGEVHITELLVVHNGTTASATEYATIYTGASPLASYEVDIDTGNVRILATSASTNSTIYKVSETLITS